MESMHLFDFFCNKGRFGRTTCFGQSISGSSQLGRAVSFELYGIIHCRTLITLKTIQIRLFRCALGYPDAYAKVSYLYDWVKQKTGVN